MSHAEFVYRMLFDTSSIEENIQVCLKTIDSYAIFVNGKKSLFTISSFVTTANVTMSFNDLNSVSVSIATTNTIDCSYNS